MKIRLRYFAITREMMGSSGETRELPDGTTAGALFDQLAAANPRLANARSSIMLMLNQEYAERDALLHDGDELALIPPVSGGADDRFRVGPEPLDPVAVEAMVSDPSCGAILTFTGTVRDHARGKEVSQLEYEAYPEAAGKMLAKIAAEIGERWGIDRVAIHHRTGIVPIGEASVVISVASPHRDEAFQACRHAIERIKEIVPIWKRESYGDGDAWIGSEADYQRETGRLPAGD